MMNKTTTALIKAALVEDLGNGDITSEAFIPEELQSQARIITRKKAVAAGLSVAREVFNQIDPTLQVTLLTTEGATLEPGAPLLEIEGATRSLLSAERVALNFLGRLMGIATLTQSYVDAVAGTGVTILDTRKMTPGWRLLEKEAVKLGGGKNHRIGLFDAVLIKDNHLAALGTEQKNMLPKKIQELRLKHPALKIEIEADTLEQVAFFLAIKDVNVVLLDNMSLKEMRQAVALKNQMAPTVRLEASGGITLENIRAVAETGVDEISLGALTHSALWADLSLEIK
ncbi:MAG: carboxylating nicotinate-nucleotide diphosphorylase [Chthoniobacterales bacterium]|nr:carboxylating nicotinate-nucleotide diphosphorylase [Chthoniobacterales bacterium]